MTVIEPSTPIAALPPFAYLAPLLVMNILKITKTPYVTGRHCLPLTISTHARQSQQTQPCLIPHSSRALRLCVKLMRCALPQINPPKKPPRFSSGRKYLFSVQLRHRLKVACQGVGNVVLPQASDLILVEIVVTEGLYNNTAIHTRGDQAII